MSMIRAVLPLCAMLYAVPTYANNDADLTQKMLGIWGVQPTQDGRANVIEIKAKGEAVLHPFRCDGNASYVQRPPITQSYRVAQSILSVTDEGEQEPYVVFKIQHLDDTSMRLESVQGSKTGFSYQKLYSVKPLCVEYKLKLPTQG